MPTRFSDLLQEYDELVDVVASATHTLHQASLSKWFSLIDETLVFAREVSRLEKLVGKSAEGPWHGQHVAQLSTQWGGFSRYADLAI